jgi:hypothetical protein
MTRLEKGSIRYTRRAFHQDVWEAMRGDIVRGIIELITNSDDAYISLQNGPKQKKIIVEVEHRRSKPWLVVVKDRATGMMAQTMIDRITRLGGRTSGFEHGKERRGNLGRGAKDVAAFGDVTFKSICGGHFAELLLRSNGDWELLADRKVSREDRDNLGIPRGNGTVVTILAKESIVCPRHDTLYRKLSSHFQLRDILSDPYRRVELVNLNDETKDTLIYEYPDLPVVFDRKLKVDGYPNADAYLKICRHNTRYEEGSYDPGRPNGILIKGKRAIYENTLFSFENNIHSGRFTGKLTCEYIDQLAREYDDRLEDGKPPSSNNPVPIISRRREGLNPEHPFYQKLKEAAEQPLSELIKKEEERAKKDIGRIETPETRRDLERLAREIGRLINEELRDIEAEELPDTGIGEPPAISIVPEVAFAYIGEDRTLTVAVRKDLSSVGEVVQIELDPEGVADLLTPTVELQPHSRRDDLLVGQIRLRPLIEGEATLVMAKISNFSASAIVEIKPPREVVEEEVEPPEILMFERPSYRIGWQRTKNINLIAPADVVAEYGERVKVSSSNPGIIIRTPTVQLKYDEGLDFYSVPVEVEARTLEASGVIRAVLADLVATTQVKVTRKEKGPGIKIELVPEHFGAWRAIYDDDKLESGEEITVLKIAGQHPAIRPYLGDKFEGVDSPICRELIAEAVADVSARMVVEELYQLRRSAEDFDATRIYVEHNKRIQRFLPRVQRILVGDVTEAIGSERLSPVSILETSK